VQRRVADRTRPTLWVADVTNVRRVAALVYLAVVVDAFSRRIVGWALDDHLEARSASWFAGCYGTRMNDRKLTFCRQRSFA